MQNKTQNLNQDLGQNKKQEKPKTFWQRLKMWQKIGIIILGLIPIYIIVIPLLFCTNIDFDFSKNQEYISCSGDSDCIAKTCGCLNEKGANKFSFWTAFCGVRLGCLLPSSCSCQDRKCTSSYDYGNDILEEVSLITDKIKYQTGEEVKLTVGNNLKEEIFFGILSLEEYQNNSWNQIVKDIYCECNAECKKLGFSIKASYSNNYSWNQKIGLCNDLTFGKKLRFKIELWNNPSDMRERIYFSNEFTIGEIQEVSLTTDKIKYQTGEEVKLMIGNNLEEAIEFYAVAVEKLNNNEWEQIIFDIEGFGFGDKMQTIINSKNDKSFLWDQKDSIGIQVDDGEYRFQIGVWDNNWDGNGIPPMSDYYSNEFTIGEIQDISLTIDKTEYQQGEEVKLTIENNVDKEITFDIISLEVETDKWEESSSKEGEIIIDNIFDEFIKDIHCSCNTKCSKLPLSIKANSRENYVWDQKVGLCGELPIDKKLRFKIIYWPSAARSVIIMSYSNEFIIKSDLTDIGRLDKCNELEKEINNLIEDIKYCQEDNDCEVASTCDCKYSCIKRGVFVDCPPDTPACEITKTSAIPECVCKNNKCIDKNFLTYTSGYKGGIIKLLIQQMGDDNVLQEVKNEIPEKLYDYGKEAIPYLIEALDDERIFDPCYMGPSSLTRLPGEECERQRLVKSECVMVIKRIITPSPYPQVALDNKGYRFFYKVNDWQQWWNKNQDKSLNEIRKMVRDWYRAEEEKNNYPATGYRGEEYDYLDFIGNLTHDDWDWDTDQKCHGLREIKQCDYLDWPISYGCRVAENYKCYNCIVSINGDVSACEKIILENKATEDFYKNGCYYGTVAKLYFNRKLTRFNLRKVKSC